LLGDPTSFTGMQSGGMLGVVQHLFQTRIRVEVRDRDLRDGDCAASPHGAAQFSMRPLLYDDAPRPVMKVTEQVIGVRAAIDEAETNKKAQEEAASKTRRTLPPGQYLQWGTTVSLKVELATRLPGLSFVEAALADFDPNAIPPALAAAIAPPPVEDFEATKGTVTSKGTAGKRGSAAPSRVSVVEKEAAKPEIVIAQRTEEPVEPLFGRLAVVMDYAHPTSGVVLRALLGRLLSFEPALSVSDNLQQYMPWRAKKAAAEPEAPAGKKAPPKGKGAPVEEEGPNAERVPALDLAEDPAQRGELHCCVSTGVSGFEVMDGVKRILVFEGLTTVVLRELVAAVYKSCDSEALSSGAVRVVFNKNIGVPLRNYNLWPPLVKDVHAERAAAAAAQKKLEEEEARAAAAEDAGKKGKGEKPGSRGGERKPPATDAPPEPEPEQTAPPVAKTDAGGVSGRIRRMRLREPLESIACANKNLRNYAKRRLSDEVLRGVDSLRALATVTRMTDALERWLFPTAAQLVSLDRVYGTTLSTFDVCGDDTYQPFIPWVDQLVLQPPKTLDCHKDEALPPLQEATLRYADLHEATVLRANAECARMAAEQGKKPTSAQELTKHLGQDIVLIGRPVGVFGRRGEAPADDGEAFSPAWLPDGKSSVPLYEPPEGTKRRWLDVPAVSTRILLLLSHTPVPLRRLKLRVQGQLVPSVDPASGRRAMAVLVYRWDEAQTGAMPADTTRNTQYDASIAGRAKRLPYTSYRGQLAEDAKARQAESAARAATLRKEEAGESSGSDEEALNGEHSRMELPKRRAAPPITTDYVWANSHMESSVVPSTLAASSGRFSPRPPVLETDAQRFAVGCIVEADPSTVAGVLAGMSGVVCGHSPEGVSVNFGAQGTVELSPHQLRLAGSRATAATDTIAFAQLSGGWRSVEPADLTHGKKLRVWGRGRRVGQKPRTGCIVGKGDWPPGHVRVRLGGEEVDVPISLVEVPAKFAARPEPPPINIGTAVITTTDRIIILAGAVTALFVAPKWRRRAVASFAYSQAHSAHCSVDTVFADAAGARDPEGPWRLSGKRGGKLTVVRRPLVEGQQRKVPVISGALPVPAEMMGRGNARREDGEWLTFEAEMTPAEKLGVKPPDGLVGDATLNRGLPAVWISHLPSGQLWSAMHDHKTLRTAFKHSDGKLMWNTAVRPREREAPNFRVYKKQDAIVRPHPLSRTNGMLDGAPKKPGLGLQQPPLSIHSQEPHVQSPLQKKPEVSTVYYPSKKDTWGVLDNKAKKKIDPVGETDKQGALWGR